MLQKRVRQKKAEMEVRCFKHARLGFFESLNNSRIIILNSFTQVFKKKEHQLAEEQYLQKSIEAAQREEEVCWN